MQVMSENQFTDPDCAKCLRKKLDADSVAVFFCGKEGWRISSFQGDRPSSTVEVEFQAMVKAGVPGIIASKDHGILANSDSEVAEYFPQLASLFPRSAIIGCRVNLGSLIGVRLATRNNSHPFSDEDLNTLQCYSECPEGC